MRFRLGSGTRALHKSDVFGIQWHLPVDKFMTIAYVQLECLPPLSCWCLHFRDISCFRCPKPERRIFLKSLFPCETQRISKTSNFHWNLWKRSLHSPTRQKYALHEQLKTRFAEVLAFPPKHACVYKQWYNAPRSSDAFLPHHLLLQYCPDTIARLVVTLLRFLHNT